MMFLHYGNGPVKFQAPWNGLFGFSIAHRAHSPIHMLQNRRFGKYLQYVPVGVNNEMKSPRFLEACSLHDTR